MTMPIVHLMCGPAGSGKSTVAKQIAEFDNSIIFESDDIRRQIFGDAAIQADPARVFSILYQRAYKALLEGHNVIIDATNISIKNRKNVMRKLGSQWVYIAEVVCPGVEVSLARNFLRGDAGGRFVPEDVIKAMYSKFVMPTEAEGFSLVRVWEKPNETM